LWRRREGVEEEVEVDELASEEADAASPELRLSTWTLALTKRRSVGR
jgi:hypothetical protein